MADPINNIVDRTVDAMPAQDDPANYEWWREYHEKEADRIAAQPPGAAQSERVGQLQGEMDHRAAAAGFRAEIERAQDKDYAAKVVAELKERGVVLPSSTEDPIWRDQIVADTRDAFRDNKIPEELAGYAVDMGNLDELPYAADREAFYLDILAAKDALDALAKRDGGAKEVEELDEWKQAIAVAQFAWERKREARQMLAGEEQGESVNRVVEDFRSNNYKNYAPKQQPESSAKAEAGLQQASAHWALTSEQVREKYPLLQSDQEAQKVMRAGARRAWFASQIPENLRTRFGIDTERIYNNGMERAYQKLVDKQANGLLKERGKALENLRGVNPTTPAHLLPSRQYRAAENLVRIDQELRRLRPLSNEQFGAAVSSATVQAAPQRAAENAPAQRQEAAATGVERALPAPAVATQHDAALKAVREIRAQVPVDGYRSKAAEAMANRIVQQLQEGRETVQLSTRYAGGDQGQANATHRNAVEANAELIEAVRSREIPVDTGAAMVASGKKPEVELNAQVEADHAMETLL